MDGRKTYQNKVERQGDGSQKGSEEQFCSADKEAVVGESTAWLIYSFINPSHVQAKLFRIIILLKN